MNLSKFSKLETCSQCVRVVIVGEGTWRASCPLWGETFEHPHSHRLLRAEPLVQNRWLGHGGRELRLWVCSARTFLQYLMCLFVDFTINININASYYTYLHCFYLRVLTWNEAKDTAPWRSRRGTETTRTARGWRPPRPQRSDAVTASEVWLAGQEHEVHYYHQRQDLNLSLKALKFL